MKRLIVLVVIISIMTSMVGCSSSETKGEDNQKDVNVSADKSTNETDSKDQEGTDSENLEETESNDENEATENNEDTAVDIAEDKKENIDISILENKTEIISEISNFNFSEAANKEASTKFEIVDPMYNVPEDKQFKITLNLGTEPFDDFQIENYFGVYTDRECENKLLADIKFDRKANEITIRPDKESWAMYPREGLESDNKRTWGSLQTYYLLISHDVQATKVTELEKPKRMMFTIGANIDSPTVTAKLNSDGNITLYWKSIPDADEYKVYYGGPFDMKILGTTEDTEFILTEEDYEGSCMNTLLSSSYEYAVVAVKDNDESRLSNLIIGEEYLDIAPDSLPYYEEKYYNWDDIDSLLDLPTQVDVQMCKYIYDDGEYLIKSYPVVWNFDPIEEWGEYEGKVLGTQFSIYYSPYDNLPTEEEIAEFYEAAGGVSNAITTDAEDIINIPNSPSNNETASSDDNNDTDTDNQDNEPESDITEVVAEPTVTPEKSMEVTIAEGMLNLENSIDLSGYQEAGDPIYLKDVLEKVMIQYPLILGEKGIDFDFDKKILSVEYDYTKEEAVMKQVEILSKVQSIVDSVITPDMTVEEKEQVLHDYITENGQYHDEVLEAYLDGMDINMISDQYADSFNPYGILINGLGVCQSYAEAYKLLCDAAEVPCVVATGTLGSVPHAWNKVKLDDTWYHVDATNNDGDGAIPYAVFNASDKLVATDFAIDNSYVMDSEFEAYMSSNDDKDYYMQIGSFAQTEEELQGLLDTYIPTGQPFFIKVVPEISDDTIFEMVIGSFENYSDLAEKAMFGKMFNVMYIIYLEE